MIAKNKREIQPDDQQYWKKTQFTGYIIRLIILNYSKIISEKLYVCMCVCAQVCMFECVYMCMCVRECVHVCISICLCVYVCL